MRRLSFLPVVIFFAACGPSSNGPLDGGPSDAGTDAAFPPPVAAQHPSVLRAPADYFDVPVTLSTRARVAHAKVSIAYDPNVLQLIRFRPDVPEGYGVPALGSDAIDVGAKGLATAPFDARSLGTLRFQVRPAALPCAATTAATCATVTLTAALEDPDGRTGTQELDYPLASLRQAYPALDWCTPGLAVRPDTHTSSGCSRYMSDAFIAENVQHAQLGDPFGIPQSQDPACTPQTRSGCKRAFWDSCRGGVGVAGPTIFAQADGAWLKGVDALRKQQPLYSVYYNRFDIITEPRLRLPGFKADWLLKTTTPWQSVLDFFAKDATYPGCSLSTSGYGTIGNTPGNIGDALASTEGAAPDAYAHAVHYIFGRGSFFAGRKFYSSEVEADQTNDEYVTWAVSLAKTALQEGHYSAVNLNHKLAQWIYLKTPKPADATHPPWIVGPNGPKNLSEWQSWESGWSAPPSGFGYPDYVRGLVKLSRELRKQAVRYTFETSNDTLWAKPSYYDDTSTTAGQCQGADPACDEAAMLREVAENADRLVLIEYNHFDANKNGTSDTLELSESLKLKGIATLYVVDPACGFHFP